MQTWGSKKLGNSTDKRHEGRGTKKVNHCWNGLVWSTKFQKEKKSLHIEKGFDQSVENSLVKYWSYREYRTPITFESMDLQHRRATAVPSSAPYCNHPSLHDPSSILSVLCALLSCWQQVLDLWLMKVVYCRLKWIESGHLAKTITREHMENQLHILGHGALAETCGNYFVLEQVRHIFCLSNFLFFFCNKVSVCSSNQPLAYNPLATTFWVLELQVCSSNLASLTIVYLFPNSWILPLLSERV